jgi:hypothetical protein
MKKIIIAALALLCAVNNAEAFNAFGHQTIAVLADTYLTDNAKKEVKAILKSDMAKASTWLNTLRKNPEMAHTKGWHYTTLAANGKSITMDENDGVVVLEKAIAVLRNRANESDAAVQTALRTVIHLVADLHSLSHIRIDGVDATKGFTFVTWNEATGKGSKNGKGSWFRLWESHFINRYTIFTPQYYADDIDIFARENKAEYEKGTPRFWVENGGEDVVRALKHFNTGEPVPAQVTNRHEYNHTRCMAKAAYRLAALLNDIFK